MAPAAAAFAPKLSQVLMTPEPHFLPGYGGYCPRYKFTLGQTYGQLTSQLLAAPSRSGRLLLQPNCAPKERLGPGRRARGKGYSGVPGYTGFVPRAQHHFAKTYGEICRQAWLEFASKQEPGARGRGQVGEVTEAPQLESRHLPALPTAETDAAAAAPLAFWPPGTPLALERTFVSGFTGFVPRLQFLIGASYPILAHRAMVEFDEMLHKTGQDSSQRRDPLPPLAKTYPTDRGLLPHYRGYVPGYKFQFGHTYGHLTCNALGQTTLEKQVLDVTQ
ncbi:ciliary microtubule inner protein 2B [Pituophis catenifer annectens]|uniref:ciliary microtubule inner protein 2B n=1 Tax=Pituophis catenifer annectens TaxID=94852 RepID=UPI003992C609